VSHAKPPPKEVRGYAAEPDSKSGETFLDVMVDVLDQTRDEFVRSCPGELVRDDEESMVGCIQGQFVVAVTYEGQNSRTAAAFMPISMRGPAQAVLRTQLDAPSSIDGDTMQWNLLHYRVVLDVMEDRKNIMVLLRPDEPQVAVLTSTDSHTEDPIEIIEKRKAVKRLKFAEWDVDTCVEYQHAGYDVCTYDRATGYDKDGKFDSIGNYLSRGCDGWLERAQDYCPRCATPGACR